MSAIPKNRRRRPKHRINAGRSERPEPRVSEAVTVAWTVTVMTLIICELSGLAAALVVRWRPDAVGLRPFVGLTQFSALVLAVVSMSLLPIMYRVRRVRPPSPVVAFAVIAAAAPFVVTAWQMFD